MTMVLTWQGSEIRQIDVDDEGTVRMRFSAASVCLIDADHPGQGSEGFVRPLVAVFTKARVEGDVASALGSLADGVLHHVGQRHQQMLMPFSCANGVQAELVFHNGTVLQIEAEAVSCTPGDDSRFSESMAC